MAVREPAPEPLEIKETLWSVWPTWESWTWPGYEGKPLQVEVYSKYPMVRLYLNKKLIGEQKTSIAQEFKAVFTVPYTAGELLAVGVQDSKEVGAAKLKTSANTAAIKLRADRSEISANGQGLVFVTVELTDKNGVLQPNSENRINFDIEGPGKIIGLDNANLKDVDPYISTSRRAWKGRALVVIKSTKSTGMIKLKASSPGLTEAAVVVCSSPEAIQHTLRY